MLVDEKTYTYKHSDRPISSSETYSLIYCYANCLNCIQEMGFSITSKKSGNFRSSKLIYEIKAEKDHYSYKSELIIQNREDPYNKDYHCLIVKFIVDSKLSQFDNKQESLATQQLQDDFCKKFIK